MFVIDGLKYLGTMFFISEKRNIANSVTVMPHIPYTDSQICEPLASNKKKKQKKDIKWFAMICHNILECWMHSSRMLCVTKDDIVKIYVYISGRTTNLTYLNTSSLSPCNKMHVNLV